ncbi:MAG: DNA polymerase III subunit alpha [Bacilli bacterium]|nr:DNA polymerase III subunit alpha [Bacilli bacterium]
MRFAPLHIVTCYSLLQSGLTMERIARAIKGNNYFAMGMSDIETMAGIPPFVKMMEKSSKPYLIGEEFNVDGDNLSLYVLNEEGYRNLIKLNSISQRENLTIELLKEHASGLAAVLETVRGKFKDLFVENYDSSFNKYLLKLSEPFKDNFYLGIEVTSKEGVKYANRVRKFANEFTYQCIAFPKVLYEKKDDKIILDMVDAISNDIKLDHKVASGQDYFMSEDNYAKIYSKVEMDNTIELVKKSTFNFSQKRGKMLHYPVENSENELRRLCEEKLETLKLTEQKYKDQLNHELETIFKMGYADYFLIVMDYVNYAKTHDILVGPGRGSAAGSLVSYLLGISMANPLDYGLQFERFLNPYRQTMPDIDVDFMDNRRDDMIQYLRDKYGSNRVGVIVTFQTIGARQSLRDVGRIFDYNTRYIDLLSKKLTNKEFGLRESYKKLPEFRALVDSDKFFLEIVALASKLEGLPRQSGLHASGVIINDQPLEECIPVSESLNESYITQYEAEYLEEQGLLKMDFLALSNLTIIYNCVKLINERHNLNLNCDEIPYDEKEIFDLILSNKVLGIFQIETQLMRRLLKVLKPSSFDDIAVLLALDRPGPMKYASTYAKRKEGKERFGYLSDDLKEILAPTYGIIVYQEQINNIAVKMAGFTLGEADLFRRAVSKKDKDKLAGLKKQFVDGCLKKGYTQKVSEETFNDILKFAEYGFNKSHSVVYAIIACRMAWLKAHYPLEFYVSLLGGSSATSDSKFSEYVLEMNSLGIKMLPPDINESTNTFIIKDNNILFPLTGIKEVNINMMEKINNERNENGRFKSFFDFISRMFNQFTNPPLTEQQLNSFDSKMEILVSSGAFDDLYPSRESMRRSILKGRMYAQNLIVENGQLMLDSSIIPPPVMAEEKDDPAFNLDREFEVLGVMLSDNPLTLKKEKLEAKGVMNIIDAKEETNEVLVAGLIKNRKVINTKKGEQMAFIKIFDETDELEFTVFPRTFKECSSLLEKNALIIARIKKQISQDEETFIAEEIKKLEDE